MSKIGEVVYWYGLLNNGGGTFRLHTFCGKMVSVAADGNIEAEMSAELDGAIGPGSPLDGEIKRLKKGDFWLWGANKGASSVSTKLPPTRAPFEGRIAPDDMDKFIAEWEATDHSKEKSRLEAGEQFFNVTQVTIPQDGRQTVFVLKVPADRFSSQERAELTFTSLQGMWGQAWGNDPPRLLVLSDEMELTALTDVQLTNCGLMRIPTE